MELKCTINNQAFPAISIDRYFQVMPRTRIRPGAPGVFKCCLLYTSDAADEMD